MRILIIRHGDPDYENDSLTPKGHREAALLAERLKKEKIDYIYSSPLGRAKMTCDYALKAMGREKDAQVLPWLKEFEYPVQLPTGEHQDQLWDMLPEFWTKEEKMYDPVVWKEQAFFQEANIPQRYQEVIEPLDELLKAHGYTREGRLYKTEQGNTKTIAFFCHFGLQMILLSHLLNISPVVLTHHFVAAPTSITTIYTEERRKGIAQLRCASYGDISHLYAGGEAPSFAARFCETFESEDRHD